MSSLSKKIITSLILGSFLVLVLFSFALMFHIPGEDMPGDCLVTFGGESICPQDTLSLAVYHISSYQSFLGAPVGYSMMAIIFLLLVAFAFTLFAKNLYVFKSCARIGRFYDSPPDIFYGKSKITHWLSLFENSPSH